MIRRALLSSLLLSLLLFSFVFTPGNFTKASEHIEIIPIFNERVDFLWLYIFIGFFDYDYDGLKDSFDLQWLVSKAVDDTEKRSFTFIYDLYVINDTDQVLMDSEERSHTFSDSSAGRGASSEIFHMNDTSSFVQLDWLFETNFITQSIWDSSTYHPYDENKRDEMIALNSSITDSEDQIYGHIIPRVYSNFYLNPETSSTKDVSLITSSELDTSLGNLNYLIGIGLLVILSLVIFVIRRET